MPLLILNKNIQLFFIKIQYKIIRLTIPVQNKLSTDKNTTEIPFVVTKCKYSERRFQLTTLNRFRLTKTVQYQDRVFIPVNKY